MGILGNLFGKSKADSHRDPAIEAIFQKINTLLTDEKAQNQFYSADVQQQLVRGGAVDYVPNASGDFGRDMDNPIPVNGSLGELVYISNLSASSGGDVVGHRLGNLNNRLDIYEVVSINGSQWDILIFDMYHTRKSRIFPRGYSIKSEPAGYLFATNKTVDDFPVGISRAIKDVMRSIFSIPILPPQLDNESIFKGFSRPSGHVQTLEMFSGAIQLQQKMRSQSTTIV